MRLIDVLVLVIVFLPPIDWAAALILSFLSREHPDILVLRERAIAALVVAIAASVAGVLGWAFFGIVELPAGSSLYVLAIILILISVPSLVWLLMLAAGRWKLDGEA